MIKIVKYCSLNQLPKQGDMVYLDKIKLVYVSFVMDENSIEVYTTATNEKLTVSLNRLWRKP